MTLCRRTSCHMTISGMTCHQFTRYWNTFEMTLCHMAIILMTSYQLTPRSKAPYIIWRKLEWRYSGLPLGSLFLRQFLSYRILKNFRLSLEIAWKTFLLQNFFILTLIGNSFAQFVLTSFKFFKTWWLKTERKMSYFPPKYVHYHL